MDKNKCFQPFRPWISENKAEGSEIEVMENLYKNGAQAGWIVQFMEKRDDFSEHLRGHYANESKHPSTTSCGRLCGRPRNNFMTSEAVVYRPIPLIPWSLSFARIARPQTMPTISRPTTFQHINHRGRFKKYPCTFCTMAFCNYGQLRSHIRSHTGEKPFACDHKTCGRAFSRNEELTRHKRIHTGEKPYSCEKCGKNFARKDHMKKHFQSHDNTTSDDSGKCGNPDKR